jgi:nitroreductase
MTQTADPSAETALDAANLTVLDALLKRRSVVTFKPECPPRELIEQLLDVAAMAPNHYVNQPWRFIVLTGEASRAYGEYLAQKLSANLPDPTTTQAKALLAAERAKPLRSPVLIVGVRGRSGNPKSLHHEDVAATAAALENMFIAAPALGLGVFWRTGAPATDKEAKDYLGVAEDEDIVGFLYVGYPATFRDPQKRTSGREKAEWRGWSE